MSATDLDRYLTDELMERTVRALYAYEELEHPFESLTRHDLGWLEGQARTVLSAVLPEIIQQAKADAWDEGHRAGCSDPYAPYGECDCNPNPYRADRIEQGGQP